MSQTDAFSKDELPQLRRAGYFRYYIRQYGYYFWMGVVALAFTDVLDVIPPLIIIKGVDKILNHASVR